MAQANFPFRRILILTQYFHPEPGAPSIRLAALCRELRNLDVDVQVITGMPNYPTGKIYPDYTGKFLTREMIDGVPVTRVWLFPAAGRHIIKRLLNYFSFTLTSCGPLFAKKGIDLVFVEAQPITLAIPAFINLVIRGIPYVYNTPDLQIEFASEDSWVGTRWMVGAAEWLESFLMRKAMCVTTVTHAFMEHFIKNRGVPRSQVVFLPNGADTEQLRPLPFDEEYARKMGINGRKAFTFAGTHAIYQGLDLILDAAALLKRRKDIVIVMVGDGPERARLIERAQHESLENVLFKVSPFSDMGRLMSITHASLVVLRATEVSKKMRLSKTIPPLSCGVPVIYAGWGESAQIIENEKVGIVTEPGDATALAMAIEKLTDDNMLRLEMGKRGRSLVERDFSWKEIVRKWLSQIQTIHKVYD